MTMTFTKINPNSVSLAGEFAVLSQLALRGYDANMTLGRTKSVDILVSNPANGQMYQLEVKTNLKNNPKKGISKSKVWGNTDYSKERLAQIARTHLHRGRTSVSAQMRLTH